MARGEDSGTALVTGGAGFIGSHIVDRLVREGWRVVVVDDLSRGRREQVNPAAEFHQLSVLDPGLSDLVAEVRPGVVFHLAAQIDVRRSVSDPPFDANANILGSLNLLDACAKAGVRRFIFSSTGGAIYGEPRKLPATERLAARPDSPYGVAKLAVEHYARFYQAAHGMRAVCLRYGNVYGPRQDPHGEAGVIAIFVGAMLDGARPRIYGDGEQVRDYVYVDDVVEANMAALTRNPPGPVNIGTGVGTSVNELYRKLARALGYDREPVYAPARPGEVRRCYLACGRASRHLGWRARVSLDEGLARTIEYFRGQAR
jgi:UDP-glucose 4-epimerase